MGMHHKTIAWAVFLAFVEFGYALPITISGVVVDTAGQGIDGAHVRLENVAIEALTGKDGGFTLTGNVGVYQGLDFLPASKVFFTFFGNTLSIIAQKQCAVSVHVFSVSGTLLWSQNALAHSGNNSLVLPRLGAGVHIFKMCVGNEHYIVRRTGNEKAAYDVFSPSSGGNSPAKQAKVAARIADIINVTKEGWLPDRDSVRSPDTTGMRIRMLPSAGTVIDADGNVYNTVKIGSLIWTVENLRTTKYNDGTTIPSALGAWTSISIMDAYVFNYKSDPTGAKYGAFYNWYAVNTGKLAPKAWRVPTSYDWSVLAIYLAANGYNWDGSTTYDRIAKAMATKTDWLASPSPGLIGFDADKNNASGFSAVPVGIYFRKNSIDFEFQKIGQACTWWSKDDNSFCENLDYLDELTGLRENQCARDNGYSVRLVRDAQ